MSKVEWPEPAPVVRWHPRFVDGFADGGSRFVLELAPQHAVAIRGAILCIQPFAEEANLSRRVLVAQASRMAQQGWVVWILDLFGTGDSEGESESITLDIWRRDLFHTAGLLEVEVLSRSASTNRVVMWGTRLGCQLVVDTLRRRAGGVDALILWQPGTSSASVLESTGRRLGTRAAATRSMEIQSSETRSSHHEIRGQQEAGGDSKYAMLTGHRFLRSTLSELASLSLEPPSKLDWPGRSVGLVHMSRQPLATAAPAASIGRLADQWTHAGSKVYTWITRADPFWTSIEPVMPTEAFAATLAFQASL